MADDGERMAFRVQTAASGMNVGLAGNAGRSHWRVAGHIRGEAEYRILRIDSAPAAYSWAPTMRHRLEVPDAAP